MMISFKRAAGAIIAASALMGGMAFTSAVHAAAHATEEASDDAMMNDDGAMNDDAAMNDDGAMMDDVSVVVVGGEDMFSNKNIVENALNSKDHTTVVAAVVAADLGAVLTSAGPFTVFAPVNNAFEDLPDGTVDTLLKPANKGMLTSILTYHVVPGALTKAELEKMIDAGGGEATLNTASGGTLTASMNGPQNVVITDAKGGTASIDTYDILQSNGVIHSIDAVLLP